jgi:hypothetical protein
MRFSTDSYGAKLTDFLGVELQIVDQIRDNVSHEVRRAITLPVASTEELSLSLFVVLFDRMGILWLHAPLFDFYLHN